MGIPGIPVTRHRRNGFNTRRCGTEPSPGRHENPERDRQFQARMLFYSLHLPAGQAASATTIQFRRALRARQYPYISRKLSIGGRVAPLRLSNIHQDDTLCGCFVFTL